ncbi:MAG: hypothetical protein Q4A48_00960 [Bacillota bacterium]|nr:hypothetical protein [Bacillota bacterium]MDO4859575.1 hypothetical protein [Bacillota bacterium]
MRYIGFYKEMNTQLADNGSIHDAVVDEIDYDRDKIVHYLKECGREVAYGGARAFDLFTNEEISPGFSLMTDGVFGWRSDLIYHIEHYNISLPKDFLTHVQLQFKGSSH